MHALRLTTRFREDAFQGEACLLVYDEQHINGTMFSDDIRDLFDSRPSTARVYILAPFVDIQKLQTCFLQSSAFDRVKNYFHAIGGKIFLLTYQKNQDNINVSAAIPYVSDSEGKPIAQEVEILSDELRNGWMFHLFDKNSGRLDAPVGIHFGKASGKHSDKFLRVSEIILTSASCAAIAYFTLGMGIAVQAKRIFVDTAPLIAIAFAIQRIAVLNKIWELEAPVSSFSSYGGISRLPTPSGKDLLLISASTSGSLVERLKSLDFDMQNIFTIFFLESSKSYKPNQLIVCDLTFRQGQSFGYSPIESFQSQECPLCKKGFILAELEGDQFLLEKRAIKKLAVKKITQTNDAREILELITRKNILNVLLFESSVRHSEFSFDISTMLSQVSEIRCKVIRALKRYLPIPLKYIVLVDISEEQFKEIAVEAEIESLIEQAHITTHDTLRNVSAIANGGVLVLFGLLENFSKARDINAMLRTKAPKGCVAYISALTIADNVENLNDLKTFLTYGEEGKDTFTYYAAANLMLPFRREEMTSWDLELELLRQIQDSDNRSPEHASRLEYLLADDDKISEIFWNGKNGPLEIKNDFVYLDTKTNSSVISQADIFATISNLIASVRENNRGLNSSIQIGKEPVAWKQSVYGHILIDPSNFNTYNDAILRAAFLRAAKTSELQYLTDQQSSFLMRSIIENLIFAWNVGEGECLPEFLIAMATKRLALTEADTTYIKTLITAEYLPEFLITLGKI